MGVSRSLHTAGSHMFFLPAGLLAIRGIELHPRHCASARRTLAHLAAFSIQRPSPFIMWDTRRAGGRASQIFSYTLWTPASFRGLLFLLLLLYLFVYGPRSELVNWEVGTGIPPLDRATSLYLRIRRLGVGDQYYRNACTRRMPNLCHCLCVCRFSERCAKKVDI
jgi:hypothetical protein